MRDLNQQAAGHVIDFESRQRMRRTQLVRRVWLSVMQLSLVLVMNDGLRGAVELRRSWRIW